jgi:hypothetical protein
MLVLVSLHTVIELMLLIWCRVFAALSSLYTPDLFTQHNTLGECLLAGSLLGKTSNGAISYLHESKSNMKIKVVPQTDL